MRWRSWRATSCKASKARSQVGPLEGSCSSRASHACATATRAVATLRAGGSYAGAGRSATAYFFGDPGGDAIKETGRANFGPGDAGGDVGAKETGAWRGNGFSSMRTGKRERTVECATRDVTSGVCVRGKWPRGGLGERGRGGLGVRPTAGVLRSKSSPSGAGFRRSKSSSRLIAPPPPTTKRNGCGDVKYIPGSTYRVSSRALRAYRLSRGGLRRLSRGGESLTSSFGGLRDLVSSSISRAGLAFSGDVLRRSCGLCCFRIAMAAAMAGGHAGGGRARADAGAGAGKGVGRSRPS